MWHTLKTLNFKKYKTFEVKNSKSFSLLSEKIDIIYTVYILHQSSYITSTLLCSVIDLCIFCLTGTASYKHFLFAGNKILNADGLCIGTLLKRCEIFGLLAVYAGSFTPFTPSHCCPNQTFDHRSGRSDNTILIFCKGHIRFGKTNTIIPPIENTVIGVLGGQLRSTYFMVVWRTCWLYTQRNRTLTNVTEPNIQCDESTICSTSGWGKWISLISCGRYCETVFVHLLGIFSAEKRMLRAECANGATWFNSLKVNVPTVWICHKPPTSKCINVSLGLQTSDTFRGKIKS